MGVKVTVDKTDDMMRAVKLLTTRRVLIGIPDVNAAREPSADDPSPINNAALGYIHEFGSPINNIPARPFLVPGVASIKDQAIARLKKAAQAALDPNGAASATGYGAVSAAGTSGAASGYGGAASAAGHAASATGTRGTAIDKALNAIGLIGAAAVQKKITDGPFAPLAPATIAARVRRGRTGTKPLLDTGKLRQAITFVLRDKGK